MQAFKWLLAGAYLAIALVVFLAAGFLCLLGGEDLWKPFVYAALWPLMLVLFFTGRVEL